MMRVPHSYDASFVLQYILHELEQSKVVNVKEISLQFEYDESSVYKLLKKIDHNFAVIDINFKVIRVGCGTYKMVNSSSGEEMEI